MMYEILYLSPQQKWTWDRTVVGHVPFQGSVASTDKTRRRGVPGTRDLCKNLPDLTWRPPHGFSVCEDQVYARVRGSSEARKANH